jgi:hypothetical protein
MKARYLIAAGIALVPLIAVQPLFSQMGLEKQLTFETAGIGFGARALAMGGAFIALADDITAINYNPAGLAHLIKPEFSIGGYYGSLSLDVPQVDLGWPGWESVTQLAYTGRMGSFGLDYAGFAIPFKLGKMPLVIGAAYQAKVPNTRTYKYVRAIEYVRSTDNPDLSETDTTDSVYDNTGAVTALTFSLALRPFDFLRLGANINLNRDNSTDFLTSNWDMRRFIGNQADLAIYDYEDTRQNSLKRGISYDFGILLKFDFLSIGAVYKTSWQADWSQSWSWTGTDITFGGALVNSSGSEDYSGKLHWPYSYGAGISLRPTDLLTITADYNFTKWSKSQIVISEDTAWGYPIANPQDTRQLRGGLEYLVLVKGTAVPIRIGGFLDRLMGLDAEGDPIDFKALTFGTGIRLKGAVLDVAYLYYFGSFIDYNNGYLVSAKNTYWKATASLSFRFGK